MPKNSWIEAFVEACLRFASPWCVCRPRRGRHQRHAPDCPLHHNRRQHLRRRRRLLRQRPAVWQDHLGKPRCPLASLRVEAAWKLRLSAVPVVESVKHAAHVRLKPALLCVEFHHGSWPGTWCTTCWSLHLPRSCIPFASAAYAKERSSASLPFSACNCYAPTAAACAAEACCCC